MHFSCDRNCTARNSTILWTLGELTSACATQISTSGPARCGVALSDLWNMDPAPPPSSVLSPLPERTTEPELFLARRPSIPIMIPANPATVNNMWGTLLRLSDSPAATHSVEINKRNQLRPPLPDRNPKYLGKPAQMFNSANTRSTPNNLQQGNCH